MDRILSSFIEMLGDGHKFVLLDIGAMGGVPSKWLLLEKGIDIIGFEPDPREFEKLPKTGPVRYFNYILNDKAEDTVCYVTKGRGKSSVFKPNTGVLNDYEDIGRFRVEREETILSSRVKTLDSLMEEKLISDADFMKMDTQGSELRILRGGEKHFLPRVFGIQTEVEFVEIYKGQPLFRQVDDFLDSKGFALMDIRRQYWKRKDYHNYRGKGQLVFADALYFRKIEDFYRSTAFPKEPLYAREKILKAVLTCLVYRIFDYAVGLAKSGMEHGHLSGDESAKVVTLIKRCSQKGIPAVIHLGKVYNILNYVMKTLKPPSYLGWVDGDSEIGNIKDE